MRPSIKFERVHAEGGQEGAGGHGLLPRRGLHYGRRFQSLLRARLPSRAGCRRCNVQLQVWYKYSSIYNKTHILTRIFIESLYHGTYIR